MSLYIFLIYNIYHLCCTCIDFYDLSAWGGCWFVVLYKEVYLHFFKCVSFLLHGCCGEWDGWARKPVNHASWVAVVTPTDRPKSVRNRCVIEHFLVTLFVLSLCPFWRFVGVGAFVIGLSHISSFFSLGQFVVQELVDTQMPGCPMEYENIRLSRDGSAEDTMPFKRSRYDARTGQSPSNPRQQVCYTQNVKSILI